MLPAKPGSRRCRAAALSGRYFLDLWKRQEMKSTSIQGWLNLMLDCPPPPPSPLELWLQLSALESGMAKCNKKMAKFIHRAEALSSCISLDQDEERTKYQAQGGRKQKMSPQPVKVRTMLSMKPESRRCQAAALPGRCQRGFWKQHGMKWTNIQRWLNLMPHRPPLPELGFHLSATSESTYKDVSKVSESKMQGGSSVRSLESSLLKESNKKYNQIHTQGWLNLTTRCPLPPWPN